MNLASLIVEDDAVIRASLQTSFRNRGLEGPAVGTVAEARRCIEEQPIDLVLVDLRLPDGLGLEVLESVRNLDTEIVTVVMTAFPEVRTVIDAMRLGASEFLIKPFELAELHMALDRALERRGLRRDVQRLAREQVSRPGSSDMIGESPVLAALRENIRKVAAAATPVLVTGETGSGKELVADAIHRLSPRARQPLVKANCSTFSETLLESEIFGHEEGAFTGARETRIGLFEMAEGGTLFLDEIAEMRPELQAKLLRILEGQPFRRVGGRREIRTNVRVIAATQQDLLSRIRSRAFRDDLYFRLNAFQIHVPPLRDRGNDIVLLARHLLQRSCRAIGKGTAHLTSAAEQVLRDYAWPGNVRELQNVMERAAILAETEEIGAEHLPSELRAEGFLRRHVTIDGCSLPTLAQVEQRYIQYVLAASNGNLAEAARVLNVARNTLKARLRALGADLAES